MKVGPLLGIQIHSDCARNLFPSCTMHAPNGLLALLRSRTTGRVNALSALEASQNGPSSSWSCLQPFKTIIPIIPKPGDYRSPTALVLLDRTDRKVCQQHIQRNTIILPVVAKTDHITIWTRLVRAVSLWFVSFFLHFHSPTETASTCHFRQRRVASRMPDVGQSFANDSA